MSSRVLTDRDDNDSRSYYMPDRRSSPASVYSSTSERITDVHGAESLVGHTHSPAGSYECRSLNGSPSRRTEDSDTKWLAYAVKTSRKDKNGSALYQCQYENCGHEQTKQAVKRHVNDVHFNKRSAAH